ncbi:hypothetical protein N2152v2_000818 [Parachlorella kessleri]
MVPLAGEDLRGSATPHHGAARVVPLVKPSRLVSSNSGLRREARRTPVAELPSRNTALIVKATAAVPTTTSAEGPPSLSTAWQVSVSSTAVLDDDDLAGRNLLITVVDRASNARSDPISLDGLPWDKQPSEGRDGYARGWSRKGELQLPPGVKTPGALLVQKLPTAGSKDGRALDYITSLKLKGADGQEIEFLVNSWVASDHGERIFFANYPYLPQNCPPHLLALRQQDLDSLRGTGAGPTSVSARSYGYQVYNDLGKARDPRPTMGGSKDMPYPRHLANLRSSGAPDTDVGKPWVPYDEEFEFGKHTGFMGGAALAAVQALAAGLADRIGLRPSFRNNEDVYGVFQKDGGVTGAREPASLLPEGSQDDGTWGIRLDRDMEQRVKSRLDGFRAAVSPRAVKAAPKAAGQPKAGDGSDAPAADVDPNLLDYGNYALNTIIKSIFGQIKEGKEPSIKFEAPKVMAGRRDEWMTDEEYGRQFLAGQNPCTLSALRAMPAEISGSAIGPQHVDEELKRLGSPGMEELVAQAAAGGKPRLYWADYWYLDSFWDQGQPARNTAEHAGRIVLFLTQDADGKDTGLIPLAIELKCRLNSTKAAQSGLVYTRQDLAHDPNKEMLWRLAKAIFRSLDTAVHQLISHWLRSHACMEPFAIALRRQLSTMHPVYKLMLPHFRYTLDINARARSSLINAGKSDQMSGLIESNFTPHAYSLRYSSAAYKGWTFAANAVPEDLKLRGMVDANGKPWMDYPYADDGTDLWQAYVDYFGAYLRLYYGSDADVQADTELQAWWEECKNQGHPDVKLNHPDEAQAWGFAGPIPTVDALVHVLATVAWTSSAHHAAVNFGQYDFSGLLMNASPMVRKPIPDPSKPNDPEYKALVEGKGVVNAAAAVGQVLFDAGWSLAFSLLRGRLPPWTPGQVWGELTAAATSQNARERQFLTYIASPFQYLLELVTLKLLSTHADDEETINMPNALLTDPAAVEENAKFVKRVEELEKRFEARNKDPARWTRMAGRKESMEYTLLLPSSPPGLTMRGVPYSVSI